MRFILMSIVVLGTVTPFAHADPHNLAGGALIAHFVPEMGYRYDLSCENYQQYFAISDCDEQVNSIHTSSYLPVVWFVLAAFPEEKQWCGVEFGFSDYNQSVMAFSYYTPCYPPDGGLEIPSHDWPGPNQGTAFVTTGAPWVGEWQPVYMLAGYAYGYYGSGLIQLVPDPTVSHPFAGFGNCGTPPQVWDAALGGMGINEPGTWVCWGWENFVCCVGNECVVVQDEEECIALGGVFHPDWDNCGPPNPCVSTPVTKTSWGNIKALYR